VRLAVEVDGARVGTVNLRETVQHGRRCHFVFDLLAPADCRPLRLSLRLVREHPWRAERAGVLLFDAVIPVRKDAS
jgi:hypothetical protein